MNLSTLKIRTKLTLAFGTVLALLAIVSATSTLRIQAINSRVTEIIDDHYAKISMATDLDQAAGVQARYLRNAIIGQKVPEVVRSSLERVDKSAAENSATLDKLRPMIRTPKGKELLAAIEAARGPYASGRAEVIRLLKDGKADEAGGYVLQALQPVQEKYLLAIVAFADFQAQAMAKLGDEATAEGAAAIRLNLFLAGFAALVAIALATVITRSLTRQLGGEPGTVSDLANSVARGDLSVDIDVRAGDTTSVMAAMRAMRNSLLAVVGTVRQNAEGVATASAQIAQGNADLSQRTEEQASALEQTAAAMEQLGSTVRQNADNARQANQLAMGASTVAIKGGDVVNRVVTTMQGINESSKKIADIISVIDGIAFQTNILALNAAVEAARAGEQGRGFAVVASEVRSLAHRSAEAAKEIKSLISASVERVEQGTTLVDQAGATMTEVVTAIRRVTDIMGEISAASSEQSTGVAQVGEAVTQMDQATQQNAALVEESAAAAESLKVQALQLVQAVAVFKLSAGSGHGHHASTGHTRAIMSPHSAAKPVAKPAPATERRGPNRATNVVRPAFTPAPAATAQSVARVPASAGADDWESF